MDSLLEAIARLKRPVFSTAEVLTLRGGSRSSLVQSLHLLEKQGIVTHLCHGLWMLILGNASEKVNLYTIAHHCIQGPSYISFTSALHLHGMIEQVPQAITVASTTHTRTIRTVLSTYFVHRIAPSFFDGYDWYHGSGSFLIATPEKALIDCLYVSSRRNKRFAHFPELAFPRAFGKNRARTWVERIADKRIRANVARKLETLLPSSQDR